MESQFQAEETAVTPTVETLMAVAGLDSETEVVPQDEAVVQAWLEKAHREVHKRKKSFIFRLVLIAFCWPLWNITPILVLPHLPKLAIIEFLWFNGLMITSLVAQVIQESKKPFPFDMDELTRIGGVRAIGPLVEALSVKAQREQKKALYAALMAILLHLKASDSSLLTPAHRRILVSLLKQSPSIVRKSQQGHQLILALLKALEQIGDETFLPAVEQLASRKSRSEEEAQIREAAEACLPYLRERIGQAPMQQTLLRPSSAEPSTPETLLRPAAQSPDTPAEQLLRPTEEGRQ